MKVIRFKYLDTCCRYLARKGYARANAERRFTWVRGGLTVEIEHNFLTGGFFFVFPTV